MIGPHPPDLIGLNFSWILSLYTNTEHIAASLAWPPHHHHFPYMHVHVLLLTPTDPGVTGVTIESDPESAEGLFRECVSGDADFVHALLMSGASPNSEYAGYRPIVAASFMGQHDIVRILLDYGARVNQQDSYGYIALIEASNTERVIYITGVMDHFRFEVSTAGHIETVKLLLARGAQVNLQDKDGDSALTIAEHTDIVQILLEHGAQVNMQNKIGNSALLKASRCGNTETVKLLLAHRAQVDMQNIKGNSALLTASWYGNTETVKLLLAHGAQVSMQNNNGNSALLCASWHGNTEIVKLLLAHGAQVNTQNEFGETALLLASFFKGHIETIKLLIASGAQVNLHHKFGLTALILASSAGNTEAVKHLLDHGAEVNSYYGLANSPLLSAILGGHTEVIDLLLNSGADVNVLNIDNCVTPLMTTIVIASPKVIELGLSHINKNKNVLPAHLWDADLSDILSSISGENCIEILRLLLTHGAQVNTQGKFGITALILASETGNTEAVKLLIEYGAEVNMCNPYDPPLTAAIKRGHTEILHLLLDHGADVNLQGNNGVTALIVACSAGNSEVHAEIVELLLNCGADVILPVLRTDPSIQSSALSLACFHGHTKVVKTLLSADADVNWHDECGMSPLATACYTECAKTFECLLKFYSKIRNINYFSVSGVMASVIKVSVTGHAEVIELLLGHGAEVNQSVYGMTALGVSSFCGHTNTVKQLLDHDAQVNVQDANPLKLAVWVGQTETVRLLLECGAHVNANDGAPLLMATLMQHSEIVKFMIRDSVSYMKECKEVPAIVRSMVVQFPDAVSDLISEFVGTSSGAQSKIIELLLEYGADGSNALLAASVIGHTETVKILLDHGAKVNMQNVDGWSALMGASLEGHSAIVQLLLDHGAQVNMLDSEGNSALIFATLLGSVQIPFCKYSALLRGNKEEYMKTVSILLHHGAEVDKATSVQLLASTRTLDILQLLFSYGTIDSKSIDITQKRNSELVEKGTISPKDEKPKLEASDLSEEYIKRLNRKVEGLERMLMEQNKVLEAVMFAVGSANLSIPQIQSCQREELCVSNSYRELVQLASDWRIIGGQLGLPPGELNNIAADHPNESKHRLQNMLEEWFKMIDPSPSWEQLVKAVEVVNKRRAREIHEKYVL